METEFLCAAVEPGSAGNAKTSKPEYLIERIFGYEDKIPAPLCRSGTHLGAHCDVYK